MTTRLNLLTTLCLLVLACDISQAAVPTQSPDHKFVGTPTCSDCHQEAYKNWQGSDHDLAMQVPDETSVLGDFANSEFVYNGARSRFFRRGKEFWVNTEGPDGKLQDYRVEYVFGVHPLQQYLLSLPGGRLHALSIAWDTRPGQQGGQNWFHLYPDEKIDATDPLHWTGPYQNWNTRCAECHSTNLQKNFDPKTGQFSTTWSELNVACEACHGPGRRHVTLARADGLEGEPAGGFPVKLGERGGWAFHAGEDIAHRTQNLERSRQVENCGRCHSRRGTLGDYEYGRDLLDTHRLSLLEAPLYHPDGQILDEVYVYGSFTQSKMYQAGVVCSNCHEPHSNALRAPGNAVCATCHKASAYDTQKHHRHRQGSTGAQCANCHMPETTYMVVDPRRDHSMRVPRPDLSVVIGTPNACNQCHSDQNPEWSVSALREWGVSFRDTGSHHARAFAQARNGDARAVPELLKLALAGDRPAIMRATAMVELGNFSSREAYQSATALLQSEDPLLRLSAVRALEFLPRQQLFNELRNHLEDSSLAVRLEIARVLAPVPLAQLNQADAAKLQTLYDQYLHTLAQHADMPGVQLQLGTFFIAQSNWEPAELALQRALQLNPQFVPALMNLADLYRILQREEDARALLLEAVAIAPGQGAARHALGLLETRAGNRETALKYLAEAAERETAGVRHRYVYAIALNDGGNTGQAIEQLQRLLRSAPANPDILLALVTYCHSDGRLAAAKRYAARLTELDPGNAEFKRLYERL